MPYPITDAYPADASTSVDLYECALCGGYYYGCCKRRTTRCVTIESQWGDVTWEEWLLLESARQAASGAAVEVRERAGKLALWRV